MVDDISRIQKPQRFVIPATQERTMADMMGAPSLVQQMPATQMYNPNYANNMKTMYTAGVTTFHPKNVQMITTLYPTNLPPQAPGGQQMMITNYYPRTTMQTIPTFHSNPAATPFTTVYNPKMNYEPMSTFHPPKSTGQNIYYPKGTLQSVATNAIPTGYLSQFHPRMETKTISHKSAPDSIDASTSQIPYMTMALRDSYNKRFTLPITDNAGQTISPTLRPNVKSLLAKIGLEPDSNALEINNEMSEMQQSSSTKVEVATKTVATTTTASTPTTATATTKKPELTPELKELLLSFGLLSNEERSAQIDDPIQDEVVLSSPSSLKDESLSLSEFKPLPKSVTASNIEEKIDSSSEIKADDFSSFKPLPIKENAPTKDDELESLLKSYGILEEKTPDSDDANEFDSQNSGSEAIDVTEKIPAMSRVPDVDVGFLTPDLTKVLGNMGINNINKDHIKSAISKNTRRHDKQPSTTATQASPSTIGTVPSTTMENDYQKLHLLLDTIKELDSLTANLTDEELEKLNLRNFNLSQDVLTESIGRDPSYDSNAVKNEVKREINSSEPTRIQLDVTGTTTASIDPTASDDLGLDVNDDDDDDDDDVDDKTAGATATTTAAATTTTSTTTEPSERKAKQDNSDADDSGSENVTEKDTDLGDSASSSTTTTTEESKSANIGELAASFGGNDGLDPVSEEPLPPPRKNGFYFFADWNSFLEVGLDDDKVEVKFEPKVGDNSQFVPVKIP